MPLNSVVLPVFIMLLIFSDSVSVVSLATVRPPGGTAGWTGLGPAMIPNDAVAALRPPGAEGVDVGLCIVGEPAPMGIADYGVGPHGPYEYATNASLGEATILSLSVQNSTGDPWVSLQLNVNLVFTANGNDHVYWVQDVVQIDTSSNEVLFLDNIWNSTSRSANMDASAIAGNGQVATSHGRDFYYDWAGDSLPGNGMTLSYPAAVSLTVKASVDPLGRPTVSFQYEDGFGIQTYDTVSFEVDGLESMRGFLVTGNTYSPVNLFYDSELVLGGVSSGFSTTDIDSDLRLSLSFWNGHNYQSVPNAYNFGCDTAEAIDNVRSEWYYLPASGTLIAEVRAGHGSLGRLYDEEKIGIITVQAPLAEGILYVSNSSDSSARPKPHPFSGHEVTVAVYPGSYLLQLYQNDTLYDQTTEKVGAGQTVLLEAPLGDVRLTLSYSIIGGAVRLPPPLLTYVHGGVEQTAELSANATAYHLDRGTHWSVTDTLQSSPSERWQTVEPTTGVASLYQTVVLSYYHQYLVTFTYTVVGGGDRFSTPSVEFIAFGGTLTTTANSAVWADSGSNYTYTNPLNGSTTSERWSSNSSTGIVSSGGSLDTAFHHQFLELLSYYPKGLGSPPSPELAVIQHGTPFTIALTSAVTGYWVDAGSAWAATTNSVGSSRSERWMPDNAKGIFSPSSPEDLAIGYRRQYYVSVGVAETGGGSASPESQWYDEGTTLLLTASSLPGWQLGLWVGEGLASYSGNKTAVTLDVSGPVNETAVFYPGLDVSVDPGGVVSYAYGSVSGRLSSSGVLHVPPGSAVTLIASPISPIFSFNGWGRSTGTSVELRVEEPTSINARFGYNIIFLGVLIGTLLAAVAAASVFLVRRGRSSNPAPATSPSAVRH